MDAHRHDRNGSHDRDGRAAGRRTPRPVRALRCVGAAVILLLLLAAGLLVGLTLWLTPHRLARIVSEEASGRLCADVSVSDIDYTLWSTFPRLQIRADSLYVRSRTLDRLPASARRTLPAGSDFLLSARGVRGGIDLPALLRGRFRLGDVSADTLRVNLVAVSDTLCNYDIVRGSGNGEVPYFSIDSLGISGGGSIRYRSLPSATDATVRLSGLRLVPRGRRDEYALSLSGRATAESGGLTVIRDFPFGLDGDVHLRFRPFGVSTDGYRVSLGEVRGRVSADLELGGAARLNGLTCRVEGFTMRDLMQFLPPGDYPVLSRINADLTLDASARLLTPYSFSSLWLPSAEILLDVPDGEVSYTMSDGARYTARQVGLSGRLLFDGRHPDRSYVDIPRFHVSFSGADADMQARITGLTGDPVVSVRIEGKGDLAPLSRTLAWLRPYAAEGKLSVGAGLRFRLHDDVAESTLLDLRAGSERLRFNYGPCRIDVRGFRAVTDDRYAGALTAGALADNVPVDLHTRAEAVRLSDARDSLTMEVSRIRLDGHLGPRGADNVARSVTATLGSGAVTLRMPRVRVMLDSLALGLTALRMDTLLRAAPFTMPGSWLSDARTLSFAPHTPAFLRVRLPDTLRKLMSEWRVRLDAGLGEASVRLPGFPAENSISSLDLTASFDSISLRHVAFGSGDTRGTLSARVRNLRQFLNSPVPAPLDVRLDLRLDTVQINQLARAYTAGHPGSAIARGDKAGMAEGVDTVSMLIPRNLRANIAVSAMQTRYINLHLYDLMTRVRVADGRADIDTLHISSDFGAASMRYTYDTSDMQKMNMATSVNVEKINVVRFFQNFRRLLEMMPEMKNLSGEISAQASARALMFPTMYLNVPSTVADVSVRGLGLRLKQTAFVRHVTRMLMLPGDGALSIDSIGICAGVHANLLEVYPFTVDLDSYHLTAGGLNNFNGDMYYHIGVDRWPLRIPFGINIKGHYRHPVLRFGGKDWHDGNGTAITSGVMDYNKLNIIRETRRYMGEFVHTAASYEGD
ncbi:MAG: hypothetical protein K2I45_09125 [Muribaculaceae bacterium]|nr:hypothetical protein [Muribaculaceae bacterium]